jgi:hypothetical protein
MCIKQPRSWRSLTATASSIQRSIVETKAETLREFVRGLSGTVRLTFEEGTQAAWLHDLLKPYVAELVVCNARALGKPKGTKSDEADSERLARLLRMGELVGVYHGEHGTRTLKQLARTYGPWWMTARW